MSDLSILQEGDDEPCLGQTKNPLLTIIMTLPLLVIPVRVSPAPREASGSSATGPRHAAAILFTTATSSCRLIYKEFMKPAHGRIDRNIFESREHPRVRITAPIVCSFSRVGIRRWLPRMGHDGIVLDMSLKGARILSETVIHPGDRLTLTVRLPYQIARMRVAVATVQWEKEQIYGVEFTKLSPVAETRLRMFLAAVGKSLVEIA